jgi:hypothetical protein
MRGEPKELYEIASSQRFLVSRRQALEAGLTEKAIDHRVTVSRWLRIHDGVYQVDRRPLSWESKLLAAVLACGPGALASHRAALVHWGLDGVSMAPVEVTMPYGNLGFPEGAIIHRTRRPQEPAEVRGIPVTTVERTLLDCAARLSGMIIGKALDSAIRRGFTTDDRVYDHLLAKGGRGVKGTKRMRWVIRDRIHDTATGSGSEFELLRHMMMAFLPRPELQHPLFPENGRRIPDFYWPALGKAVEVDGVDAHASADKLDDDLVRQNALMDLGIELRRFSARLIRREPDRVVAEIRKFLES